MVHSGYHSLKHRPLRLVLGWYTVDTPLNIPLNFVLLVLLVSAWMVHSGYHPHKPCPLRLVLGWCTEDIILLKFVLLG